ncbi:thiopurine S-methyltransferase [Thalassolituus sp. LLYu03]|uniref:thiopurine S-methyltransferase n=1 Tax=Thalassolituus sp. LLYu03 TaxID=3421656 RepID=UPI003D29DF82
MEHSFWHDKWEKMEIGFHLDEVNKALLKYWPELGIEPGQSVLIPLCGKTLDLIWLRSQGVAVIGVELSEIALDELAQGLERELGLTLSKASCGEQVLYRGDGVLLVAGDFFALTRAQIQQETGHDVAAVYDRAAIVALPDAMRAEYARHVQAISAAAPQLLITLDYDQTVAGGPPFAVSSAEVAAHYQAGYAIDLLDERELIDQEPRFKAKGLASFVQRVYRLRPLS